MANRVLLGKRGSEHGVFVSKSGVDVTDSTSTTPLSFDSNAASSLIVHAYGECLLPALNDTTSQNFTRTWNGVTYNSSGVYNYVTTNLVGCDSIVTLDLTINNSSTNTVSITSCDT